MIVDRS